MLLNARMVGITEAIANLLPLTARAVYAASRISSNLKGTTKQFGWLQGTATKVSCLSVISANPATIRICNFRPPEGRPLEFLAHAAWSEKDLACDP